MKYWTLAEPDFEVVEEPVINKIENYQNHFSWLSYQVIK